MLHPKLASYFCGMRFQTPVVLLSGCVGFGQEYTRVEGFSHRDIGAVCLKGTTLSARPGNPTHRVYETPSGMLNAIGLQNPGANKVVDEILPSLNFQETRFIANVSGSTIEEYTEVTRLFDQSAIDAIEINISCPNVKEGGVTFGNDPDMSARVVEACRSVTNKPLITKLSPNQTNIADNAQRCIDAGSDAFSVINTLMGMAIDTNTRTPIIGNVQGGLSGPAIKPIALLKVHQVYQVCKAHNIPIIGQGGITTANDALEFIIAGASAVGLGTGLFYDPLLSKKVNDGIVDYLDTHQLNHFSELIGSLDC
ncbi:MAG: dihydroorotate dehydrogenase [Cycloclasticus pugetii]|jgi:dihydroorotate dehydrogenase (NAD+) catalytic subunit|uniref:Dihydroorotate dehydrogenase n=1 Tax=Cycloclasticus zancles 78-ME TaxID=1198232 RepID=S5T497_9GAMM|nr:MULTISPECIES: dihydroorotate dehydrogenase [Cycloclasticus]AFT66071.1 Dihydroorotate dehydrogenase 1 [Cycloclasticus sp. P1]AGS38374.1 Dihydroorotate dehydrogenase [Cycloclasticus zancles 78-ME]MBV1897842.1 dihydroorotate dehydrogenase [Cycloclasticus sp.]PHR50225.1 MAG: dihydroorotate dehydrogenase B catalytic subunit [Cycloclasticus sp.]SHJ24594.1 dihydroorotate oxidase B, catalytic subunit [Cycloclasticus pugetii]